MGWSSQAVTATLVIVSGSRDGIFVYAGRPGAANPPIAWVTQASADPYGNAVKPQVGTKDPATGRGVNLSESDLVLTGSHAAAGGADATIVGEPAASGAESSFLVVTGPTDGTLVPVLELAGESQDGTITPYAHVFQKDSGGTQSAVTLWVSGTVVTSQPGAIGSPETAPHPLTLENGWAAVAGNGEPSYWFGADGELHVAGALDGSAATAAAFATVPAAYPAPSAQVQISAGATAGVASGKAPYIQLSTAGVLSAEGVTPGTSGMSVVFGGGFRLDLTAAA